MSRHQLRTLADHATRQAAQQRASIDTLAAAGAIWEIDEPAGDQATQGSQP